MINIENRQFGMLKDVASLAGELSIAFGQEITKHLLKYEIKQYFFNDGDEKHALLFGIHWLLRLIMFQWEPVNKKNSSIRSAMKMHRRSFKNINWPTSG